MTDDVLAAERSHLQVGDHGEKLLFGQYVHGVFTTVGAVGFKAAAVEVGGQQLAYDRVVVNNENGFLCSHYFHHAGVEGYTAVYPYGLYAARILCPVVYGMGDGTATRYLAYLACSSAFS